MKPRWSRLLSGEWSEHHAGFFVWINCATHYANPSAARESYFKMPEAKTMRAPRSGRDIGWQLRDRPPAVSTVLQVRISAKDR